jgi:hypothetical protein
MGFILLVGIFSVVRRESAGDSQRLRKRLDEFSFGLENTPTQTVAAVRAMGTNALPILLREVQHDSSRFERAFNRWSQKQNLIRLEVPVDYGRGIAAANAFHALGTQACSAIPILTNLLYDGSNYITAAIALAGVNEESVRHLLAGLASTNERIRLGVTLGLGHARYERDRVVEELINALTDPVQFVRYNAASALGSLQHRPNLSIPPLIESLKDGDPLVRSSAAIALGQFGPKAASALSALEIKTQDPERQVREAAKWAVEKIRSEPEHK